MGVFERITAFITVICITLSLCACRASSNVRIYVTLDSMPDTLDAQVAESDSELLIARNIYEGLTRQTGEGKIVLAAAEKYDFSNLTYTFTLRDNLKWADGEPLTADDFVFGLKRALSPETKAPFADLLYAIKGAKAVHSGTASKDTLGVKAVDSQTLKIKLEYDDKDFLRTLSMPVSMPCREDFFNGSIGKYGLVKECVLSNGSYRLAKWNKAENGIRLYINDEYNGEFRPENGGVFISKDKEMTAAEKMLAGETDLTILPAEYLADASAAGIKTESVQNICWVLSLGGELNDGMRKALCYCFAYNTYSNDLPEGFEVAHSFIPEVLTDNITSDGGELQFAYDPEKARSILAEELSQFKNKKFPQTVLEYSAGEAMRGAITSIVGDWQKSLSAFINIKATDKSLDGELTAHTKSLCAFPVKADSYIGRYLNKFGVSYSGSVLETDKKIASGYNLLPVAFESTIIAYRNSISNVYTNYSGGYVDFSYVVKK